MLRFTLHAHCTVSQRIVRAVRARVVRARVASRGIGRPETIRSTNRIDQSDRPETIRSSTWIDLKHRRNPEWSRAFQRLCQLVLLELPDLYVGDMAAYNFLNWWYIILGGQVGGEGIVIKHLTKDQDQQGINIHKHCII
ncbi:unnamed protein product [Boreogadus saida]